MFKFIYDMGIFHANEMHREVRERETENERLDSLVYNELVRRKSC